MLSVSRVENKLLEENNLLELVLLLPKFWLFCLFRMLLGEVFFFISSLEDIELCILLFLLKRFLTAVEVLILFKRIISDLHGWFFSVIFIFCFGSIKGLFLFFSFGSTFFFFFFFFFFLFFFFYF